MTSRSSEFLRLLQAIKDHTPEANAFLETKIKLMILHAIYKYGLAHQEEDPWQDVRFKTWKKGVEEDRYLPGRFGRLAQGLDPLGR